MKEVFKVRVSRLAELIKPFESCPADWSARPIINSDINNALFNIDLLRPDKKAKTKQDHIRKIAWYAANGFGSAITINIGADSKVSVEDGHHRLRAAINRGDEFVSCEITGTMAFVSGGLLDAAVKSGLVKK